MVYTASRSLKRQVEVYFVLKRLSDALCKGVFAVLAMTLVSFGHYMTLNVLWTNVALLCTEACTTILLSFTDSTYFQKMSCAEIAKAQRSERWLVFGKITLLEGSLVSTSSYVGATSLVKLFSVASLVPLDLYLYRALPHLGGGADYHVQRGIRRLHESLALVCICILVHAVLMVTLIFFPLVYSTARSLLGLVDWDLGVPCFERVDHSQRESEMGLAWYAHLHRHWYLSPKEAHEDVKCCGLPGYWFHSMKDLLITARQFLPAGVEDCKRCSGSKGKPSMGVAGSRRMALEALWDLSQPTKPCTCPLFYEEEGMATHMQDIPQVSRCTYDVDASRDFLVYGGYPAMLCIVSSCAAQPYELQLAASICGGFASSLPVLLWQPLWKKDMNVHVVQLFDDKDFTLCTVELLESFVHLLEIQMQMQTPDLSLMEALTFAISSFANVVSDMHAHYHALLQSKEFGSDPPTFRFESLDPPSNKTCNTFNNAFTTFCPFGWPLGDEIPDFTKAKAWMEGVQTAVSLQETVQLLLKLATWTDMSVQSQVVSHAIRALSAIWSCKMIYWHRFDKRMPRDFPDPLALISNLSNAEEAKAAMKALIFLCTNRSQSTTSILSPFSKLHLAKILISQEVRDIDGELATILLQCLCYWRRAMGPRELDWFASEVVETIHDLFISSCDAATVAKLIRDSPGGVSCLMLMLSSQVSRLNAARLAENGNTATFRPTHLQFKAPKNPKEDSETHYCFCNAAATALLYELLCFDGPTTTLPALEDSPDLFVHLLKDLSWVVLHLLNLRPVEDEDAKNAIVVGGGYKYGFGYSDPLEGRLAHRPPGNWMYTLCSRARRGLSYLKSNFALKSTLLFLESFDNPAWRPPFGLWESISSLIEDAGKDRMEHFERSVNAMLAARQAIRIMYELVNTYPQLQEDKYVHWYFHTLVKCVIGPFPSLQKRLRLWELEVRCEFEMKDLAARILACTIRRANDLAGDNLSMSLVDPPRSFTCQALRSLKDWANRLAMAKVQNEGDIIDLDLEGNSIWILDKTRNNANDCLLKEVESLALPCSVQST
ncbi:hypothetical protein CBR_g55448 [Chara braunii]|uniref:Uncharacterized protein n=1 Tax=Chara braunii TaxID=69332 RepID=A0A388K7R5_CHABU|nr:hypothetical protein CBR_g55448 [Chara braunii]|eukprot:GBG66105.1 hypothetical protein CBR_g55448 [Chara braunii]